ncbi:hypothetical protein XENTR_v10022673 [Xenopus tropicalis]|nr:hypothetical protein XENTR_v10022673 [Xenopus tropicalis]
MSCKKLLILGAIICIIYICVCGFIHIYVLYTVYRGVVLTTKNQSSKSHPKPNLHSNGIFCRWRWDSTAATGAIKLINVCEKPSHQLLNKGKVWFLSSPSDQLVCGVQWLKWCKKRGLDSSHGRRSIWGASMESTLELHQK